MAPTAAFYTPHVDLRYRRFPVVLLLMALTISLGPSSAHAQMYLAIPSYQNPGTTTWADWAAPGPGAVGIMVFDINNGDNLTYDATVAAAIQSTRAQGIRVLGYTYTNYGARNPQLVTQAIDSLYANYLVDGVFFDQTPVNCTDPNTYSTTPAAYYQALTNYVQQKQIGAGITVLNPGTYVPTNCWMSITDILVNWENEGGFSTYQTSYVDYSWVHQYSPERFWHIILGVPESDLQAALDLAQSRNAGWVYISDSAENAYNQIPVYWSAEAAAVMEEGTPGLLPQTVWSVVCADSQETACYNGAATNAIDGNYSTMWHTQFCGSSAPLPHEIQINLGASYSLTGFQYLPRQDGSGPDWINQYQFYVSADGVNWGNPVASGNFNYSGLITQCPGPGASIPPALQIAFPAASGQYVQLRALSEVNGNPWTSAAEIDVLGTTTRLPVLSSVSLNPASVVGGSISTGAVTLDGPAPPGGAVVTLSSNNTAATVAASVSVAEGTNSATFAVTTSSVASATPVSIGGSYNGNQSATLTVNSGTFTGNYYYVSTAGSDSNPGTAAAPWRTIQYAANSVVAGDTVYVLAGIYNEAVNIAVSGSAAAGPITLQSYPGETAVLDGTGLVPGASGGLLSITNQSYVTIQGLEVRNYQTSIAAATPAGIWISGAGSNIQILNNSVHDIVTTAEATGNALGIAVYGTAAPASLDSVTISGNHIYNLKTGSSESLALDGNVTNFTVSNNLIHDNDNIGIDAIGFEGVSPNAAYDYARNGEISGNTVYNISAIHNPGEGSQYDAAGIYCDGCSQVIIERNRVYNSDLNIEVASEHTGQVSSYVTVRNNLIYNANSVGISIGGYATTAGGTDHCTIVNNTLLQNDTQNTGSGEFQVQYFATNNVFENNIVYATSQGLLVNNFTNSEPSPVSMNFNLYYSPLAAASAGFIWNGNPYTGLAAYRAATAQHADSSYANPLFLSLATPNLLIQATSPALNAGTNLGTAVVGTVDFAGNPRLRGNNIDIGAYEQ